MLFTKFDHWKYEEEVRMRATISERENGLPFKYFDEHLRLNSVILGEACSLDFQTIQKAVGPYAGLVSIIKARRSWTKFEMEVETQKYRDHDELMKERQPITEFLGLPGIELQYPKVGQTTRVPAAMARSTSIVTVGDPSRRCPPQK
jgi:hypothetical protein